MTACLPDDDDDGMVTINHPRQESAGAFTVRNAANTGPEIDGFIERKEMKCERSFVFFLLLTHVSGYAMEEGLGSGLKSLSLAENMTIRRYDNLWILYASAFI